MEDNQKTMTRSEFLKAKAFKNFMENKAKESQSIEAKEKPELNVIMDKATLKSQDEKKQDETPKFNNEQMLLHLYDIGEAIELKFSKDSNSTDGDLKILFKNQLIPIEPSLIEFAFAYEELNKTFRLEAKTLIEELILRMGDGYSHITETLIIDFLNEILKEKKLQIEKEAFKRKIVWLKK